MNVHPIPFSAPEVRALLNGSKTQMRQMVKPQPSAGHELVGIYAPHLTAVFNPAGRVHRGDPDADIAIRLRMVPGDHLWVREAWRVWWEYNDTPAAQIPIGADVQYVADEPLSPWETRFRQSMHMPRWASRLTLQVTDVRVQRLQDIREADAIAEGTPADYLEHIHGPGGYRDLWTSINGKRAGCSWEANPWVCATTFKVHQQNIDSLLAYGSDIGLAAS